MTRHKTLGESAIFMFQFTNGIASVSGQ